MAGTNNEIFRKQWLKTALTNIPNNSRLLDAGAGELDNKIFCSHLSYVSQDICQYQGDGDNKGLQTGEWNTKQIDIVCDITDIPEKSESFDAILCSEVIEHVTDPLKAIMEFKRLLKPHGRLIITAPFCSLTHFSPYHFSSGFNRYFYEEHLSTPHFRIEELTANGNYFEYIAQELRRLKSVSARYSAPPKTSPFMKLAIQFLLKKLDQLSKNDNGSEELLCYGYNVIAVKL